ncbi:MAG TPA: DUF302 domain-containing protein [Candidatus Aquilonibacter sp.]
MSDAVVVKTSRLGYQETIATLTAAMTAAGNTVFATIDQAAAAAGVGLTLRPTTLIVFGNPKGGTPLMQAYPLSALELPLKLLVWEEDGVHVAYLRISAALSVLGEALPPERLAAMDGALDALSSSVS